MVGWLSENWMWLAIVGSIWGVGLMLRTAVAKLNGDMNEAANVLWRSGQEPAARERTKAQILDVVHQIRSAGQG